MQRLRESKVFSFLRAVVDWLSGSPWRYFTLIFLLSLVLRIDDLNLITSRHLMPSNKWELGSIAIALYERGEFADPYMIATGPTAHLPPLYPLIFSLIYKIFGLTPRAGYVSLLLMIVANSALNGLLPWLSERLGTGRAAGLIGGLAGAVLVEWGGHGEYLTGLAMGLLLVAFLHRWRPREDGRQHGWGGSLLLGLAAGAAFHLQPALLPVVLGCLLFELWWRKERRQRALVGVTALGILLACLPWGWRNYTTFNSIFFIRSNLGLELRMGNHEGAAATMEVMDATDEHRHPRTHFPEARRLRDIGEIAYMHEAQAEALAWIKANPAEFAWLTVQRAANLWGGPLQRPKDVPGVLSLTILAILGAWCSFSSLTIPQRAAFLIPLLTYPMVYYIVAYMPRYRVPIDWILYTLAGAAVWQFFGNCHMPENQPGS